MKKCIALIPAAFFVFAALPSMAQVPEPKTHDPRIEQNIHKPQPGSVKLDEKKEDKDGKPIDPHAVKLGPDGKPLPPGSVKHDPSKDPKGHRPVIDPKNPPKPKSNDPNAPRKVLDPNLHKPAANHHPAKPINEKCKAEFEACIKNTPNHEQCEAHLKNCEHPK